MKFMDNFRILVNVQLGKAILDILKTECNDMDKKQIEMAEQLTLQKSIFEKNEKDNQKLEEQIEEKKRELRALLEHLKLAQDIETARNYTPMYDVKSLMMVNYQLPNGEMKIAPMKIAFDNILHNSVRFTHLYNETIIGVVDFHGQNITPYYTIPTIQVLAYRPITEIIFQMKRVDILQQAKLSNKDIMEVSEYSLTHAEELELQSKSSSKVKK